MSPQLKAWRRIDSQEATLKIIKHCGRLPQILQRIHFKSSFQQIGFKKTGKNTEIWKIKKIFVVIQQCKVIESRQRDIMNPFRFRACNHRFWTPSERLLQLIVTYRTPRSQITTIINWFATIGAMLRLCFGITRKANSSCETKATAMMLHLVWRKWPP